MIFSQSFVSLFVASSGNKELYNQVHCVLYNDNIVVIPAVRGVWWLTMLWLLILLVIKKKIIL